MHSKCILATHWEDVVNVGMLHYCLQWELFINAVKIHWCSLRQQGDGIAATGLLHARCWRGLPKEFYAELGVSVNSISVWDETGHNMVRLYILYGHSIGPHMSCVQVTCSKCDAHMRQVRNETSMAMDNSLYSKVGSSQWHNYNAWMHGFQASSNRCGSVWEMWAALSVILVHVCI